MSENIPSPPTLSTNVAATTSITHPKKPHRRYDKSKLPTPPPDPNPKNKPNTCTENEFLEYLDTLQKHHASSGKSAAIVTAIVTEDAFDHLDKLYKLIDQMLELRVQNAKLHRKVRDLEHLNNLEKMYKQIEFSANDENCVDDLDKDTAFTETILESILYEPKQLQKHRNSGPNILRQSILRRPRDRRGSGGDSLHLDSSDIPNQRRASTTTTTGNKSSNVSKWTKVKAAFKWEKASPTVGDAKSLDSGISGMVPVNVEVARYLRVPSTSDDAGHSPAESGIAEISTPASLSPASSNDEFHRNGRRTPCEDFRSSDDDLIQNYSSHSKEDHNISPRSSQKSHHRTPWAKMKDIIHTRNSFKKQNRLSSHSDDVQIDIEFCSDNEDVFVDDSKKSSQVSTSTSYPSEPAIINKDVPLEVIARYQEVVEDDVTKPDYNVPRKVSKWTRVKKAFLPINEDPSIVMPSTSKDSKIDQPRSYIQTEIDRNYRQLQKKLSQEFQEKLTEWKKIKHNSPCTSNSTTHGYSDDSQDPAFIKKIEEWERIKSQLSKGRTGPQLTSEENLPPEFRKKLQEWDKIKKSSTRDSTRKKLGDVAEWKSLSGPRDVQQPIEYPVISDEFKKKLEEWKQIKSSTHEENELKRTKGDKTPSPNLNRKDSGSKNKKDKELHWFEKELNKIEKEKVRLERERQKFMEREERLSKLRRSMMGGNKKEVLVHTPSGFYKFQGISRKFTQKLYEWEKFRGISPESSTFALLSSSYTPQRKVCTIKSTSAGNTPPLLRSKSADSVATSPTISTCHLISQPSSLSLNDVDNLEQECLTESKCSSMRSLLDHDQEIEDEPEALIVEVEDFLEETAAPLKSFIEQHNPVYQRQELKVMCEGETCLSPKIRKSESTRAQTNYILIEEIFANLRNIYENELGIEKIEDDIDQNSEAIYESKEFYERQNMLSCCLFEKLVKLQEENMLVVLNITKEIQPYPSSHIADLLELVQDLTAEIVGLAEKLYTEIRHRSKPESLFATGCRYQIMEIAKEMKTKLLELRRHLTYVCAASDMTAPGTRKFMNTRTIVSKTVSSESKESRYDTSDVSRGSEKSSKDGRLFIKADTSNTSSQGAVKKRIRYRQKSMQSRSFQDTDEEEEENTDQRRKHKKLTRTRSTSEGSCKLEDTKDYLDKSEVSTICNVGFSPSPTTINSSDSQYDSPVTIFVKTTRKLFTPLVESSTLHKPEPITVKDPLINEEAYDNEIRMCTQESYCSQHGDGENTSPVIHSTITHLPPLPASPIPQRKLLKDMSPSIRLMLTKYNQKLSEQDSPNCKSGGSSGSASPVAWHSPRSERRVRAQTEKYQEDIKHMSPLLGRREVQKSASAGFLHNANKQFTIHGMNVQGDVSGKQNSSISKSSSAVTIMFKPLSAPIHIAPTVLRYHVERNDTLLKVEMDDESKIQSRHSPEIRLQKLKKAKEEFLNSGLVSAPLMHANSENVQIFPTRSRLSQISVGSNSSIGSACPGVLMKCASAGMINIDEESFKQFDTEMHGGGYVSLPRNTKQPKSSKSTISSIAAKFRKVKMRRGKEKLSAVSALCRQSLVVDITTNDKKPLLESPTEEKEMMYDSSASTSKTGSWIRKSRLFRK